MPVPHHKDIRIGSAVSIVLKADQRTGRQVTGSVAQLLTRGDHPRGVKVRLSDGRIGRVQRLISTSTNTASNNETRSISSMNPEHNPWATAPSQGNPYVAGDERGEQGQYNQQSQPQQTTQTYGGGQSQQYNHYNPPSAPPAAPVQRLQRSDTDNLLEQQEDRAEQLETMQHYESSARETDDDKNQAQLQKEFPNLDSSLIAALYSDTRDMGTTREMLQELTRT